MDNLDVYGQPYGGDEAWPRIRQAIQDYARGLGQKIIQGGQEREALMNQAFDPDNPLKVKDPQALAKLTDMIMSGEIGFAPAGVMSGASRDVIRSSADDLASQLQKLGFQADVTHSGSAAGPSSYVRVYDPETGRFFVNPVRFSGHSKGSFNAGEVRDVSDPALDIPKIIDDALSMRTKGVAPAMQKQKLVDKLIADGMKPKQAYKEADKILEGLLAP